MAKKGNEKSGGADDFTLVSGFSNGYRNREDRTTLPPGVLVTPSQNVLTNTFQRVGIRRGYTLDGQANTDEAPIAGGGNAMGVFDWYTSGLGQRNMRAGFLTDAGNDGKMQFRYEDPNTGTVTWTDLLTGLTSVDFNYITFWDEDTLQTLMLCVNGESNIRSWNGAFMIVLSGANPTGIIQNFPDPGDDNQAIVTGGYGYAAGDTVSITGGGNDASVEVLAIVGGAIQTATVNTGGSNYAIGDLFSIDGGTTGFEAIAQVDTLSGSAVATFTIIGNGAGYSTGTAIATTTLSGVGSGLLVNIGAIAGGAILSWDFASDANHGTGYANSTTYPTTTSGAGTGARFRVGGTTSGSITKEGPESWAEAGFTFGTPFNQHVIIGGVDYSYDANFFIGDTTTLYGVTPDPSGITPGALGFQGMITWPNTGGNDGLPDDFHNDLIGTLNARVFIGSLTSAYIYLSEYVSFKEWVLASTFVLTNPPTAFIPQEDAMYISGGKEEWYKIEFLLSADLTGQLPNIDRLNTTSQQASQSQAATTKIANSIAYLSFEPIIETFGPVENILLGPIITDLSFPIVNDMNAYDFDGACTFYYRKFVYVAVPRESVVLVYNMTDAKNPYWEAPQVMPIARFSIINGELYGHSNQVSETYKLFDGTNDNGFPIEANASFSFNNYGTRSQSKGYNEFYVEGYISANTTLTLGVQYDIDGCATNTYFEIEGTDNQIVCINNEEASLGKTSLGKHPLGSSSLVGENGLRPKFRVIKTFPIRYFYEDQISFSSSGLDQDWEILAFGPQLLAYGSLNNNITQ